MIDNLPMNMDDSIFPDGRRVHRLPAAAYCEPGSSWHVTLAVADPTANPFSNVKLGQSILQRIESECKASNGVLHVGCLMPNHGHLLIEVGDMSLEDIVRRAKSATTRIWWDHGGNGRPWQASFYDHGIRGHRDFDETVDYILDNPVKAGLVDIWDRYPLFRGSLISHSDDPRRTNPDT